VSGQEIAQRDHPQQVAGQLATLSTDQLKFIANTDFIPKSMRGNLPAILACVATGRALGLADMNALRSIHIIDGRATYSAELMVQLVRRAGHSITGEVSIQGAKVTGKRFDTGDEMTFSFGPEDATRAGLAGKQNYQKHPASMYWARAVSQLCRMLFADVFTGGPAYTPDEVEMTPEDRVSEALGEARPPVDGTPDDTPPTIEQEPVEEPATEEGQGSFDRFIPEGVQQ
jgi:hypothetical protein